MSSRPDRPHPNRWPALAWLGTLTLIGVAFVLGFMIVDRNPLNAPTLGLWAAICRGIGLTADTGPRDEPRPPPITATTVAWTGATLEGIAHGDAQRGAFVALNCTACHGVAGISDSDIAPTLAGLDAAVIYKQLADYGSGRRLGGAMNGIGQALSTQDAADVAVYYSRLPGGVPVLTGRSLPASGRTLREPGAATRLIFAGDPSRGIAPCSACHGPGGYKLGAPALSRQRAAYIEAQSQAFAQGMRQNDISMQMRSIARQMTAQEMRGVAQFYGVGDVQ